MKKLLILALCLLMTACADEYIVVETTTVTPDKEPLREVAVEVKEEPEIYQLNHFIDFDPADVCQIAVSTFHFGPTVSELETILEGWEALDFAKKLAALPVTDFSDDNIGQGSSIKRYTLQLIGGSTLSFCENVSLYYDDSEIPSMKYRGEYLCSLMSSEEIGYSLGQSFTWYDYIDGVRTPRQNQGQLGDYLDIRPADVVKLTVQEHFATGDSAGGWNEREFTLEGNDASAAAAVLDNMAVVDEQFMYEHMGLASGTRYTLTYADGTELSFCENGAIFLTELEQPWYHVALDAGNIDVLCVLEQSKEISLPVPDGIVTTTYYHMDGQRLTEAEFEAYPTLSALIPIRPENVTSLEIHDFYQETERIWKLDGEDAVTVANYLAYSVKAKDEPHEPQSNSIYRYILNYDDGTQQNFCLSDIVFLDDSDFPSHDHEIEILGSVIFDSGVPVPYDAEPVYYTWMSGQRH